jgi:pyruvate kinase
MFRLNFSHGTQDEHGEVYHLVRKLSAHHSRPAALLADLQGPKIQVGMLPADGLAFVRGHLVRFAFNADYEATGIVPVRHNIAKYLKKGERIFLHDGQIEVEVEKIERDLITTKVLVPGILLSNQGINLPDTDLGGEITTEKDLSDLKFAVELGADYVGYSFVQTAADIENLRTRLKKLQAPDMKSSPKSKPRPPSRISKPLWPLPIA